MHSRILLPLALAVTLAATLGACCTTPRSGDSPEESGSRPGDADCRTDCTVLGGGSLGTVVPLQDGESARLDLVSELGLVRLEVTSNAWIVRGVDGPNQRLPEGNYTVVPLFEEGLVRLVERGGRVITESVQVWARPRGSSPGLWISRFERAGLIEIGEASWGLSLIFGLSE